MYFSLSFPHFSSFCSALESFYSANDATTAEKEVIESFVLSSIPFSLLQQDTYPLSPFRNLSDFDNLDLSSFTHSSSRNTFLEILYDIDNQTLIKWLFGFSLFLFNLLFICSEFLSTSKRWPKFYDVKKKEEQAARKKPLPKEKGKEKA